MAFRIDIDLSALELSERVSRSTLIAQACQSQKRIKFITVNLNEPVSNERYKLACAPIKDSDHSAHPHPHIAKIHNCL